MGRGNAKSIGVDYDRLSSRCRWETGSFRKPRQCKMEKRMGAKVNRYMWGELAVGASAPEQKGRETRGKGRKESEHTTESIGREQAGASRVNWRGKST